MEMNALHLATMETYRMLDYRSTISCVT